LYYDVHRVTLTGARGVDIAPGNQVVMTGSRTTFNCTSSRWNQAWYFYHLRGSQATPCRIYSYRPHRLNASTCQNLSRYTVTWHDELLSLSISSTVTSDAGTYVCGDLLSPTSTCSAVLGVLGRSIRGVYIKRGGYGYVGQLVSQMIYINVTYSQNNF